MATTCPSCHTELPDDQPGLELCPACGQRLPAADQPPGGEALAPGDQAADADATLSLAEVELHPDERPGGQTPMAPFFSRSIEPAADDSTAEADIQPTAPRPQELSDQDLDQMATTWGQATTDHVDQGATLKLPAVDSPGDEATLVVGTRAVRKADEPTTAGADYELLGVIGRGGMGVVYAARQASVDRVVAVKMLRSEKDKDDPQRDKFMSEAVVTGDLDHPNIVPVYELGTNEDGALFYSMKRVQGTPWSKEIGKKTLSENVEILMKVADAIAFAHASGVVHCDLKPENVMLGGFGEVLVMDWGLALTTAAFGHEAFVRKAGSAGGGTPAYMPPEMALGQTEKIGFCTDIYLLGTILYEVVCERRPHTGSDVRDCIRAAARNEIQPTEKGGELLNIALRAMATEPSDRYASVQEFQTAVRRYQSHSESIGLAHHAEGQLAAAERTDDYQDYSRSLFGFEEALALWSGNAAARSGLAAARLAYATCALRRQDFELGLSLVQADEPSHATLRDALHQGQRDRDARRRRIALLKWMAGSLAAAFVIAVTVAFFWIRTERDRAVVAKNDAVRAQINESKAKTAALKARDDERTAKQNAVAAKGEAERSRDEAEKARDRETQAKTEAVAAKDDAVQARDNERTAKESALTAKAAEQYQSYLAQIGLAAARADENAFADAYRLLDTYKDSDLRHWEWGRLRYLCQRSLATVNAQGAIDAVAFSPDGTRFATGTRQGVVQLWQVGSVKPLLRLDQRGQYVHAIAFSPAGRWLATGSSDGKVRLFDAASGQPGRVLEGHTDSVVDVDFSADGHWLATASYDQTVRVWDVSAPAAATEVQRLRGHRRAVWSATFSPDRQNLVSTGEDGKVIVWRTGGGDAAAPFEQATVFTGHTGPVYAAAYAPDGRRIATAGYDNRVLVWDPRHIQAVDLEKRLQQLATASRAGVDTEPAVAPPSASGQSAVLALVGHRGAVHAVSFSADGQRILSGSDDNTARVWQAASGRPLKVLRGHSGWVRACQFSPRTDSPDDQIVLTGSHDQTARLWSLPRYEEIRVLQGRVLAGHADAVLAASFDAEGTRIVTASRDHTARIWDTTSGKMLQEFKEGHEFLASAGRFGGAGRTVVTSGIDGTVRRWDVASGTQHGPPLEGTGRAAALAVSADGRWILSGGDKQPATDLWQAQLWETDSGKLLQTLDGHAAEVTAVAISPDQRLLATADDRGNCYLWDPQNGRKIGSWQQHSAGISAVHFLADSQWLLTASYDKTASGRNVRDLGAEQSLIYKHPDSVTALTATADGRYLLTCCADHMVRLWDRAGGRQLTAVHAGGGAAVLAANVRRFMRRRGWKAADLAAKIELARPDVFALLNGKTDPAAAVTERLARALDVPRAQLVRATFTSIDVSPDQHQVLLANAEEKLVLVCKLAAGAGGNGPPILGPPQPLLDLKVHGGSIWSARFSPDGQQILTVGGNDAHLWDARSGHAVADFSPHGAVAAAAFSPDGHLLATAGWAGLVKIWDTQTGQALRRWSDRHKGAVYSVAFSPVDGKVLLTAGADATARLWNIDTGVGKVFAGHRSRVRHAGFSADGRRIVTASDDGTARVWDTGSGKLLRILPSHAGAVLCASFSADGRQLITGGQDNTARIWDLQAERESMILRGHTAPIESVCFSPDGRRVLTGSRDNTAKLWDPRSGAAVLSLKGHRRAVTAVRFSPDGQYVLTGSRDGTAIVWLADDWRQEKLAGR